MLSMYAMMHAMISVSSGIVSWWLQVNTSAQSSGFRILVSKPCCGEGLKKTHLMHQRHLCLVRLILVIVSSWLEMSTPVVADLLMVGGVTSISCALELRRNLHTPELMLCCSELWLCKVITYFYKTSLVQRHMWKQLEASLSETLKDQLKLIRLYQSHWHTAINIIHQRHTFQAWDELRLAQSPLSTPRNNCCLVGGVDDRCRCTWDHWRKARGFAH